MSARVSMNAAPHITDPSHLEWLLQAAAETLDVPPSAYEQATERYRAVGAWLCREKSSLRSQDPKVYPQGSFAIGAATKPLTGDDYDIDAVIELAGPKELWSPADLKAAVGRELHESGVYGPMLEPEGRRCWTLRYAAASGAPGFHMDLLPSVPLHAQQSTAIAITNRLPNALVEWRESDPKKYAQWFRERMQPLSERRLRNDTIAGIEAVPFFETRVPLQYVVQLLKRYRDVLFQHDPEHAPISIIITTLAGLAYRGEETLSATFTGVVQRMSSCFQRFGDRIVIPNPVRPSENFADRWQGDSRKQAAFLAWLDAAERLADALASTSRDQLEPLLRRVLGESSGRETLARFDARQGQARANSIITVPPAAGSISGIVKRSGGLVANVPRLLVEAAHRQDPPWPIALDGSDVRIRGRVVDERGAHVGSLSSGDGVRVGAHLRFNAEHDASGVSLYWQVTNTGPDARRANNLRGGFEPSHGTKQETALYRGPHFIECFLVRHGVCVARSGAFTVNIG